MTAVDYYDDASAEVAMGNLEAAVALYRKAVETDPEFVDGWQALCMACIKTGHFAEAIEAGKMATHLQPNDQIGWTSLSLAYVRNDQIPEAEAAGAKAKVISWGGKVAAEGERFDHSRLMGET
ncbi:MAG: tetratricopeptide repeat protein [Verrucomicrobiae bacterium]|nr:tetratricopeptide repeat protein [Verrucomicrobiae bacterium]